MRSNYTYIYIHFIWATWDRLYLIDDQIEPILFSFIKHKCRELKSVPIQIGGMPNHIHLLVKLPTNITIGDFVKHIKGSSSHYVSNVYKPEDFFKWQKGYAAISVSPQLVEKISKYISNQKEHHQRKSYQSNWELVK